MASKKSGFLNKEDILSGGETAVRQVELKSIVKDGKPGVVKVRRLPAGKVLEFLEMDKAQRRATMVEMIAMCVLDEDGKKIFDSGDVERLKEVDIEIFNELTSLITADINKRTSAEGNDSSAEVGGDLPIV